MKDLLEEGRKIQETFKKNVLTEEKINSKFTPQLSLNVGGDNVKLITPFGNITFEVSGQYDDFSTDKGVSMHYTSPKGGISQTEWKKAADRIFFFVKDQPDYLEALKTLLNPKVLTKYLPQITKGAKFSSMGTKAAPTGLGIDVSKKISNVVPSTKLESEYFLKMTKIPKKYWEDDSFEYVGKTLNSFDLHDLFSTLYDFAENVGAYEFSSNDEKLTKYFKSLYYKNGYIMTNYRGREEKELKYIG